MSNFINNAKAFEIFAKYEATSLKLTASNGEIYAGPNPDTVSDEDKKQLSEYGWKPKSVDNTFTYSKN